MYFRAILNFKLYKYSRINLFDVMHSISELIYQVLNLSFKLLIIIMIHKIMLLSTTYKYFN